jgi:ribosome-associated toxin RatA of RatAB toxin-antitoxin module
MRGMREFLFLSLGALFFLASFARADSLALAEDNSGAIPFYKITGVFAVPATRAQVWDVLTDYSALKGVVSSVQASCVLSREGNTVLVEQVAQGRFLFFKKSFRLLLNIVEQPQTGLLFTEVGGQPFKVYRGSWNLDEKKGQVIVTYHLDVSQGDMVPSFIERGLFKDNAASLLQELKAEIGRRAGLK